MKVKIFEFSHELDLEDEINFFLKSGVKVVQICYQMSHFFDGKEQIFSFSALVLYEE